MTLLFERNDITKMHVDAIVNAANNTLLGGSGVDGAIHFAAGPELLEECKTLGGCETGKAKITKGYKLPAKYVIHTVGPIYVDGKHNEKELLSSCYKNSLAIAKEKGLKSIAFPLISSGVFGYPKGEAFDVAVNSIKEFFTGENANCDMVVIIVLFGKETISINKEKVNDLKEYIDDNYVQLQKHNIQRDRFGGVISGNVLSNKFIGRVNSEGRINNKTEEVNNKIEKNNIKLDFENAYYSEISLEDRIKNIDASFSESLFKIIDSKKLKDVDVYNKANMDRKLFSKIRSGKHPSKITAIALCIALELNIKETDNLLKKAGYALSDSEYFDIIIKYHIKNKISYKK